MTCEDGTTAEPTTIGSEQFGFLLYPCRACHLYVLDRFHLVMPPYFLFTFGIAHPLPIKSILNRLVNRCGEADRLMGRAQLNR